MPEGPGRYDDLCTQAREAADADAAVLVIVGGNKGTGFNVQGDGCVIPPQAVADALRLIADEIEKSA